MQDKINNEVETEQKKKQESIIDFSSFEYKPDPNRKHQKILPIFDVMYETYAKRSDELSRKIAERQDKIARNNANIEKSKAKADWLADANAMLRMFAEKVPAVNKIIEINENKIKNIMENKIPKYEAKIKKHEEKLHTLHHKKEIADLKAERMSSMSGVIKSFVIPDKAAGQRRDIFAMEMDALKNSSMRLYQIRIQEYERKIDLLNEEGESLSALDRYKINQEIDKLNGKRKIQRERFERLSAFTDPFRKQPDEVIDYVMTETEKTVEQTDEKNFKPSKLADTVVTAGCEALDRAVSAKKEKENANEDKINADYYNSVPEDKRHYETLTIEQAKPVMSELSASGIEFSALNKGEKINLMVANDDMLALNDVMIKTIGKTINTEDTSKKTENTSEKEDTIDDDYLMALMTGGKVNGR